MRKLAALLAVTISVPAFAQTGSTGNWNGAYNFSVTLSNCSNKTYSASGNAAMTLLQTGTSVAGRLDLKNFLSFNGCTATNAEVTTAIVGTVNGSTIAWEIPNDRNAAQFNGAFDANTINAQWTDAAAATASISFTRATGDAPAAGVTGAWSGNYNFTDVCPNGGKQAYAGTMRLALTQAGANATGVMTLPNVPLYDQNCSKITSLAQSMAVAGTVSGTTFTGGVVDPSGTFEFPISAALSSGAMNGSVNGANGTGTTGTFTLTQSSTTPPSSDFGGTYEGTYTETDNVSFTCNNASTLTYSGDSSVAIEQAGNDVSGWVTFHNTKTVSADGFGNCIAVDAGDFVLPVYGTLSNNALTLTLPFGGGTELLQYAFSGDSASGQLQDSFGDFATFDATRSARQVPVAKRRSVRLH